METAAKNLVKGQSVMGGFIIKAVETYSDALAQLQTKVTFLAGDSDTNPADTPIWVDEA